ncbi:MAG: hypothetical protein QXZ09_08620 [Candidatus Methanomethylicaceae archaeon]
MAGFKQAFENSVINVYFRGGTYTGGTVYVGLYTTAPTDTTEGTEVSGGGYARQAVTFAAPSGNPAQTSNTADIVFPEATANWGTIVAVAIHSAATGTGNQIAWANVQTPKAINAGDTAVIKAGNLTITVD